MSFDPGHGGGFDPTSKGFQLGTVGEPKKKPGTFTKEDKEKMSSCLCAVGLSCGANTPEKMGQYITTIQRNISSAATSGKQASLAKKQADADDFDFTVDNSNPFYSQMMVIVEHFDEIEKEKLYEIDKHYVKRSFSNTTAGAITQALENIGKVIAAVSTGDIDPAQITSYMGKFIQSLTASSTSDLYKEDEKSWFIFVPPPAGTTPYPAIGGLHFKFHFKVHNYKDKKKSEHTSSYEMTQRNITFTDEKIFQQVYDKVSTLK